MVLLRPCKHKMYIHRSVYSCITLIVCILVNRRGTSTEVYVLAKRRYIRICTYVRTYIHQLYTYLACWHWDEIHLYYDDGGDGESACLHGSVSVGGRVKVH